jgi:hypothetical protein
MQNKRLVRFPLEQLRSAFAIREKIEELQVELNRIVVGLISATRAVAPRKGKSRRTHGLAIRAKLSANIKGRQTKRNGRKRRRNQRAVLRIPR